MVEETRLSMGLLESLRRRLMLAGGCWLVSFILLLSVSGRLFSLVSAPLQRALPAGGSLVFLSATEPILTYLTVAAVTALVVSLPVVLWQLWALIAETGSVQTRGAGVVFALTGFLAFLAGAWLGFYYVFPTIIKVLLRMGEATGELDAMLSMGDYLALAMKMMVAFGLVCELPVVMVALSRMQLIDRGWFIAKRKYMVIVGFVFGAVITPGPDVFSQCSIAIPFVILYEVGILGCRVFGRGAAPPVQSPRMTQPS